MMTRALPAVLLRRPATLLAAFLALSYISDASGPDLVRLGSFSIAPTFDSQAAGIVPIDRIRVTGFRAGTPDPPPGTATPQVIVETQVLDTLVTVPAGADSVNLILSVPIRGPNDTIYVNLALITPAGDTAFRAGPIATVPSVGLSPPVTMPASFTYTGTGANATDVVIQRPPWPACHSDRPLC